MQKILKFFAVAQFPPKALQNRPLAAIDRGLIDIHRVGHFGFGVLLPKQLFDQPPLLSEQGTDSTAQVITRTMRPVYPRHR